MRISKAWIITLKDIKVVLRKRYAIYSLVAFAIIISIGLPVVLHLVITRHAGAGNIRVVDLMNAFSFFYVLGGAMLPTLLASYSLVGEKIEKSLEPLLATPITDSELLLGKSIAAFIPSVGALYIGIIIYMILSDLLTHGTLGYYYFPNWNIALIMLVLMPLMIILSIEWSVIVSSRASDPRSAQMQGLFIIIPLAVIYVATEVGAITLNTTTLWIIAGAALVLDIVLYYFSTKIFQREEILTKWT
jgi:ABC-2 type transport system permease protein